MMMMMMMIIKNTHKRSLSKTKRGRETWWMDDAWSGGPSWSTAGWCRAETVAGMRSILRQRASAGWRLVCAGIPADLRTTVTLAAAGSWREPRTTAHSHSFIHSFIHSLTHSITHSLIHSFIHLFIHSLIYSFSHFSSPKRAYCVSIWMC